MGLRAGLIIAAVLIVAGVGCMFWPAGLVVAGVFTGALTWLFEVDA